MIQTFTTRVYVCMFTCTYTNIQEMKAGLSLE